jgi:hypothetical protein
MKTRVGIWIDHRQAHIVTMTDKGETVKLICSNAEKQLRRGGDSPLKGKHEALQVPAVDNRQKTLTEHLNLYYEAVIAAVRDAEAILIFGPGEAKGELKKRLEKDRLGALIAAVETADKMTEPQISAKVRKYFPPRPAKAKAS